MIIQEIVDYLNSFAPVSYQESYDNSGLNVGNTGDLIKSALITLDVTEEVVSEAIDLGANLIVSHHPVIFKGIKQIDNRTYTGRIIQQLIKNDIAVYAGHTNLDAVWGGVNTRICEKLNLTKLSIMDPVKEALRKIVVFVPSEHASKVREAMFDAGAGFIGDYDKCSYNLEGQGSFRGSENTNPFVGNKGETHFEKEMRIETIVPQHKLNTVIREMIHAHPYEEVAYDVYPLLNEYHKAGMGMLGELADEQDEEDFLKLLKKTFQTSLVKHTRLRDKKIKKVAVCGGSGSFLLNKAISSGADVFVSADFKYHQFYDADGKILICDIGHYESEQFTKEIFYELLTKKFTNFAVHLSKINTNPIKYI
jgi:dinuclear metal center YbgI/SA1388 family protein